MEISPEMRTVIDEMAEYAMRTAPEDTRQVFYHMAEHVDLDFNAFVAAFFSTIDTLNELVESGILTGGAYEVNEKGKEYIRQLDDLGFEIGLDRTKKIIAIIQEMSEIAS